MASKPSQPERRLLGERRVEHAGHLASPRGEEVVEPLAARGVVLHEPGIETHHQQPVLGEAGRLERAGAKAASHQETGGEQHQRDGDLRHHEHVAPPQALAPGHVDVGGLEPVDQVRVAALQRRREAAQQRAHSGGGETPQQHASVHTERDGDRQLGGDLECLEELDGGVADGDSAHAPQRREHEALGEEQPDEPRAAGAERQPDGDLARARASAAQQQPRHVGAGDQQHAQSEDREDDAELPLVGVAARADLALGEHVGAAVAVEGRVLAPEVAGQGGELATRLLLAGVGPQARLHHQLAVVTVVEEALLRVGRERLCHRQRHVEVGPREDLDAGERLGRHADDGELAAVEEDLPADDSRVARELPLPEVRPEHGHGVAARHLVLVGAEAAPHPRLDLEQRKEVAGDQHAALDPRRSPRRGAEADGERGGVRDDAVVALGVVADVEVLAMREEVDALVARGAHQRHHLARARHRVGPEDQRVEHAERRRGHADADREGDHHEGGQAGRAAQAAQREPQVGEEVGEPVDAPRVAHLFLALLDSSQGEQRAAARLGRGEPGGDPFLDLVLEVELQLLVELLLDEATAEDGPQPQGCREPPVLDAHRFLKPHQVSLSCTT